MKNVSQLSALAPEEKRALLAQMLKQKAAQPKSAPLSFAQERLWFICQLDPGTSLYNMPSAIRIQGPLNAEALRQTLTEIVRRHEALRTSFPRIDGNPIQLINPRAILDFQVIDLRRMSIAVQQQAVALLANQEAARPFNLAANPLLRVKLLWLDEAHHVLLFTMHHIISDAWSAGALVNEVMSLYQDYGAGKQSRLAELKIQYADFAAWQREWLKGEVLDRQVDYWRKRLEGAPALLEIPTDRPRPATASGRGKREEVDIGLELSQRLRELSLKQGVTLFMTLLAGFQVLLSRYSGQEDIVVGTPIANRSREEIEELIGFFVNALVIRGSVTAGDSFAYMLARLREDVLEAYAHQDLPFEVLVERLRPERSLSHTPLFQVMMVLQNTPVSDVGNSGMRMSDVEVSSEMAKFDLLLTLKDSEQGLRGFVEYRTDLYDDSTIKRMMQHYKSVLKQVAEDVEVRLGDVRLLSEWESHQTLREWNDTARQQREVLCVHEMFERQAVRTPDAVAVVYESEQLSYGELNSRANQVANYLRSRGACADKIIGICLGRSLEMVVALLGVLKSGAAYAPLDPMLPAQRLGYMLNDSSSRLLLCQQEVVEKLPEGDFEVIRLDADRDTIARASAANPGRMATNENIAYVIYTSGSSGQPKGVLIPHGALANHMLWLQSAFRLDDSDSVFQKTPFSFDASVWEFYAPLLTGGRLIIAQPGGHQDSAYLVETIIDERITTLQVVPLLLRMLLDERGLADCKSLKRVFSGGDVLTTNLKTKLFSQLDTNLCNLYGPTEATIDSTFWMCDGADSAEAVPIGRPVDNAQAYILNGDCHLAPVLVTGQLHIAGSVLGRGYLNRPDLTAEKFIPNPFSEAPGARMYKTGDLARYDAQGKIEYLGRLDQQVKYRGFRIELEEIQAILNEHPAVRESVVIIREDEPDNKQLVAYILSPDQPAPGIQELRDHLQSKLPAYMLPAYYVRLESLPLTSSGKIDRRALPPPDTLGASADVLQADPETPSQQILASIWSTLLGKQRISLHDNFFDLGGHSLLATRVISRVREAFKIELSLRTLFEKPVLQALAAEIDQIKIEGKKFLAPAILPVARGEQLLLSYSQQRLWFIDQLEPASATYNMPAAIRIQGPLNAVALEQAFSEIIRRHESLRTSFPSIDGRPLQSISSVSTLFIHIVNLCHINNDIAQQLVTSLAGQEAQRPFNLSTGPLLRVKLLRLSESDHVALVTMHHIISDGWSMSVFVREMMSLYDSLTSGEQSKLEELEIQYADFAAWQRERLQGEMLKQELEYWTEALKGAPTVIEMPTDKARPAVASGRGEWEAVEFDEELSERLREMSREQSVTMFMTLLVGLEILLCRYSRQEEVLIGTPIANRNREEVEGLIGFFVNTLVMRGRVRGGERIEEMMKEVREEVLKAYSHQEIPFEMIEVENGTSKFDLLLTLKDDGKRLQGSLEYSTDLYERVTIKRMIEHYKMALEEMTADVTKRVEEVRLLTEWEYQQVVTEWNDTAREHTSHQSVIEMFEQQMEECEDKVAVVYEEEQVSYRELNNRANQLANYLRRKGVGVDDAVGICLTRGIEMVVGVIGVLKAGGGYVPLDPAYPDERLRYMVEDAEARLVLTDQEHRWIEEAGAEGVNVVIEREQIASSSRSNIDSEWSKAMKSNARGESLAYVIYTSGSTGRPKGIGMPHKAMANLIEWHYETLMRAARTMQYASMSFDASFHEIFAALCSGGTVYVVKEEVRTDVEELMRYVTEREIEKMVVPVVVLQQMGERYKKEEESLRSVREVISTGEQLQITRAVREMFKEKRGMRLHNHYGPSESHVVTWEEMGEDVEEWESWAKIGRAISNSEIYIVDDWMREVGIGREGEVLIGGECLARGYVRKPELTAEKFIPDERGRREGGRVYRSGDDGRRDAGGKIRYKGRRDNQIKVRGYRIEKGEIERVMSEVRGVEEAAVEVRENRRGEKQIVGYIVRREEVEEREIREEMRKKLPEYMMPVVIVEMEKLPLTTNGKVDRRALPSPEWARRGIEDIFVAPRTAAEQVMADIWSAVLGIDRVGVQDNFFELGGHSLLATQVISRVRDIFQIEQLPLRNLFERPTISGILQAVEEAWGDAEVVETIAQTVMELQELSSDEMDLLLSEQSRNSIT
jgi:amino acid adenylation domain-containing protein